MSDCKGKEGEMTEVVKVHIDSVDFLRVTHRTEGKMVDSFFPREDFLYYLMDIGYVDWVCLMLSKKIDRVLLNWSLLEDWLDEGAGNWPLLARYIDSMLMSRVNKPKP